jgi:hypothetical protein
MNRRWSVLLLTAVLLALPATPLSAQNQKNLRPNRVTFQYVPAVTPEHREIEQTLKERRVLERVAEMFSPFRLPQRLTLRAMPCDGDVNAYYEDGEIKVCYEYLEVLLKRVSKAEPPSGTTRRNLLIGALADVFFHEFGHAVFEMLEIPVFGREEDAADQFSAYLMLQFARNDARQLIAGAAFWFVNEHQEGTPPGLSDYADEHGLPAQRFFNYICLAYGLDSKAFAAAKSHGKLTEDRAEWCNGEYKQVERAFRRLILPYVDRQMLAKLRTRKLFQLDPVE